MVDTQDLKSCGRIGRAGSTPAPGTLKKVDLAQDLRSGIESRRRAIGLSAEAGSRKLRSNYP